jgi:hypothetical protein
VAARIDLGDLVQLDDRGAAPTWAPRLVAAAVVLLRSAHRGGAFCEYRVTPAARRPRKIPPTQERAQGSVASGFQVLEIGEVAGPPRRSLHGR